MIPRVPKTGSSFLGAWNYYAHDKRTEEQKSRGETIKSADRVAWTHTENLAGLEADRLAVNLMKLTAMRNQRCTQSVYSFSLAWHPEQKPDKAEMIEAGRAALKILDMDEHQAMFIAHRDTDHSHVHIMVNRIHPETLKAKNNYQDFKRLSEWARGYEREHGKIYCAERESRAQERDLNAGKNVHRYAETVILDAWTSSDDGKSFQAAIESHGWKLGIGDRKDRFMVVTPSGKPLDILREVNKARDKGDKLKLADLEKRFADLKRENLKWVLDLQDAIERQRKAAQAAEREEQKRTEEFKRRSEREAGKAFHATLYGAEDAERRRIEALHRELEKQHREQQRIQQNSATRWREKAELQIEENYHIEKITGQIKAAQNARDAKASLWQKITGKDKRQKAAAAQEIKDLRRSLAESQRLATEYRSRIEDHIREDSDALALRQQREHDALPPIPEERDRHRQPAKEQDNERTPQQSRQRGRGLEPP